MAGGSLVPFHVDAAVGASAHRVIPVIPWMGYSRQDKKSLLREPISARAVARMLESVGADRVLTVDLHTGQSQGFFKVPVDHMTALRMLADDLRERVPADAVVVGPDAGRVKVGEKWADALDGAPLAFVHKTRDPNVPNQVKSNRVVGDVEGRTCVLMDDMIDTGGTIAGAVRVLKDAGAGDVIIATTHGVFSDPAAERLRVELGYGLEEYSSRIPSSAT